MPDDFDPYFNWLGIEPHERPLDHYRLLGVARFEQRREVIQAAADQRMGYIRSFQSGPRVTYTQKLLNELATAKLCLLDGAAKAAYDAALQARLFPPAARRRLPVLAPHVPTPGTVAEPPLPVAVAGLIRATPSPPSEPAFRVPPKSESAASVEREGASAADSPIYARPWFPLAAVGSVLVIAGLVWGMGKYLNRPAGSNVTTKPNDGIEEIPVEPPVDPQPQPVASTLIEQEESGVIVFPVESAQLHGDLKLDSRGGAQTATNWKSDEDWLSWEFHVKHPGVFRVEIAYAAASDAAGGRYELIVDEEHRRGEIRSAGKPDEFLTDHFFLAIKQGGRHVLSLRAAELRGKELFVFKSIRFAPRTGGGR